MSGRSRTPAIVALAVGGAALVLVATVVGLRSLGDSLSPGSCRTTKAVVAQMVPALERRFDLAELNYACQRDLASVVSDQAYLSFSSAKDYPSREALVRAVQAGLVAAGWTAVEGRRRMTLSGGAAGYRAVVTASSIAPALAIVRVTKLSPGDGRSASDGGDPRPERHLTPGERLRYLTVPAFVPAFVPPGYASWAPPVVGDLDDVAVELRGGDPDGVAPSLRSGLPHADFSLRECDVFTLRSRGDHCRVFGTTRSGLRVYIARDASEADGFAVNAVALLRGTLVTLLYAHNHRYVRPRLSRASVLAIFDSLRARNRPARR